MQKRLADLSLGALDPFPDLERLTRLNAFERRHAESYYIDDIGHPSNKGNQLIADRIMEFLVRVP